ncbi:serine hydrolase domain-containing protein [Bacillus salacetis]|uniref:serine hydrolase domain-containing protein n=1 Tax=Bacillus salacetis TaxID=2315464 RepID=UPI003B9F6D14
MKMNQLNKDIQETIKKENFSGSIIIKRDKDVIFEEAAGFADKAEQRLNTLPTRFGVASGCKIFTSAAICQLVENGLLSFDTQLRECLNIKFDQWDDKVTIHHLLTHTSGIPDYFDEDEMDDFADLWKQTPMYLLRQPSDFLPLFKEQPMKSLPGEKFHYNNAGYIVLGMVVEQLTKLSFTDYVSEKIFKKAGMSSSGYFSMDQLPKETAYGYIQTEEGGYKTNIYSVPIKGGPDGGAYITAPDMIAFWEALLNNRLLSKETTQFLLTPHVKVKEGVQYGFGVWINSKEGIISKYHVMGYDPGVSFHSAFYPNSKTLSVVLSNHSSGAFSVMKAAEEILDR